MDASIDGYKSFHVHIVPNYILIVLKLDQAYSSLHVNNTKNQLLKKKLLQTAVISTLDLFGTFYEPIIKLFLKK